MAIRLLPLTVAGGVLMLALKLAELSQHAGAAFAQAPEKPAAAASAAPAPAATTTPTTAAQPPQTTSPAPGPIDLGASDFTEAELSVLQDLASRREMLDQRATDLDAREALLTATEQRIEAKVKELKQLQASLEGAIRRYDEQEEARKKSLVKIFETMKPADAARIFEQMELPLALDVFERMKERNAAPVLAQMNPVRAKQMTSELARRRELTPATTAPNG